MLSGLALSLAQALRDWSWSHSRWALFVGAATLFAIPVFCMIYVVAAAVWKVPLWVAGLYVALSAAGFIVYAIDKSAAAHGSWRTPESTLHMLALAGGWPGALLAQQVFRHKTRKWSFQLLFWLIVLLHQALWLDYLYLHQLFSGAWVARVIG